MPEELAITVRSEGRGLGFDRLWRKLSSAVRDRRLSAAARGKEMNTISIADAPVHELGEKKWSSGTSEHVYADVSGELIDDDEVWIAYKPDSSASTSSPDSLLRTLPAHQWDASAVSVALNVTYKATHEAVVALDGLVSEEQRAELLAILRGGDGCGPVPPADRWDRRTIDAVGLAPTFGLRQSLLRRLQHSPPRAVLEIQSRLCQLYPEYTIAFLPETGEAATGRRTAFVANAATHGDSFQWHTDADPSSAMPGWHETHGVYTNGQPERPLLVSLLVYLDEQWRGEWAAETLFVQPEVPRLYCYFLLQGGKGTSRNHLPALHLLLGFLNGCVYPNLPTHGILALPCLSHPATFPPPLSPSLSLSLRNLTSALSPSLLLSLRLHPEGGGGK